MDTISQLGAIAPSQHLKVALRIRPARSTKAVIDRTNSLIAAQGPFHAVFDPASSQYAVYAVCGVPMLNALFEKGQGGCLFAFGATGSGKTFSLLGPEGGRSFAKVLDGIIPLLADDLFRRIGSMQTSAMGSASQPS
jgi:hypothetical protein